MHTTTIVSLIWLLFLALVFLFFFNQYRKLKCISRWTITEGKVTHFSIEEQNKTYWPSITYEYQVNGQSHESHHFFADTTLYTPQTKYAKRLAYDTAQAFLQEQPVTVHYNPHAPDEAVLDVKIPRKLIYIMGFIVTLILIESAALIYAIAN